MQLREWIKRKRTALALWLLDADPEQPKPMHWSPEAVNHFWTASSKTRMAELSFSRTAAKPLLLAVRHHLRPTDLCLDFGAGSGHLIEVLLDQGLSAAAYEPSEGRRSTIEAQFNGRQGFLGVVGGDHNQLYDVVFAAEVVEHILESDFEATIAAMARSLRPGGILVVTTPNNEDLELGGCVCPTCSTLFHRWQHVRSFTPALLESKLRPHGFAPVVTHLVEFNPAHFAPLEALDAGAAPETVVDFLRALRADQPIRIGAENSILCIARRTSSSSTSTE